MRIFLVRHGRASGGLTLDGVEQISRTGNFLKSLGLDISKTALLTSQLPRATQTADIIKNILGMNEVLPKSYLTCETTENTTANLAQFAVDHPDLTAVIAVSHQPEIEGLLGRFNFHGTVHNGSVHEVNFQTRTIACLLYAS